MCFANFSAFFFLTVPVIFCCFSETISFTLTNSATNHYDCILGSFNKMNTVLCKELFILCFDQIWTWKAHNYQWLSNFRIAFIWESNNSKSLGRSVLTPDNLEK